MQKKSPRIVTEIAAGQPAGIVARAFPDGAVLSIWAGSVELIVTLTPERAADVAGILASLNGYLLVPGHVTRHAVPACAYPHSIMESK